MEIDIDRKYGIDGQWIEFIPKLIEIGDQIEREGVILQCVQEGKFVLVTDHPHRFVPAHFLTKKWWIV